jgi:hypothetical protein
MYMCTDPEFHGMAKSAYRFNIYKRIYRELAVAKPPVCSDCHRLLIQDVYSSQMIKLSRQIPFSALDYKVGGRLSFHPRKK